MAESTIKLDAFNTSLHGCRILCQGPFPKGKQPPIIDSIQRLRDPFKKKILLSKTSFGLSRSLPLQYDATFQMKDTQDWTLMLTYMTYAPKPLLVVCEEMAIPDGLWQKVNRSTTIVHVTSTQVLRLHPYDAIFFAPMEELTTSYADYVYKILQAIYRSSYTQKEHKEILQELRIAGAGLAWSKEEEGHKGGSIYWYDPVTQNPGDQLSHGQMADLLGIVSEQLQNT
jgi:hypothetical protein